ncbi:MAG: hypothetical protein QXZ28_00795 [Candidatus Methanomethylicaceae archaeon]
MSGQKLSYEKIKDKWLVIKCLPNNDIECEIDEGDALETMNSQENGGNDVALIPLEKVLEAIDVYQNLKIKERCDDERSD